MSQTETIVGAVLLLWLGVAIGKAQGQKITTGLTPNKADAAAEWWTYAGNWQ